MIALAFAGLVVVLVALLVWERRQPDPNVVVLIDLVDRLCRRIQAPQLAAVEEANEALPHQSPPAVSPFSDDEYWESRELLAERLMREEVDAGSANT